MSLNSLPGIRYKLRSRQPLLLDEPLSAWVVNGNISVFLIHTIAGTPDGPRRYLFSASSGEILFGKFFQDDHNPCQLIAVADGEAELLKVSATDLRQAIDGDNPLGSTLQQQSLLAAIDQWVNKLGSVFLQELDPPSIIQPAAPKKLKESKLVYLTEGQLLQPEAEQVYWVTLTQGKAVWMDLDQIVLDASSGLVPLSSQMWLRSLGSTNLTLQPISAIQHPDALLHGIEMTQNLLLEYVDYVEQEALQKAEQRVQERQRLDQQATESTFEALASILQPEEPVALVRQKDPLLTAMGVLGKALGVTIYPPAKSEDIARVKDPLEAIVRASGIRMRRIRLSDQWWLQDSGPLLGYTHDDAPVALLPIKGNRYKLFDPVAMTYTPVDSTIAATLSAEACTFYRSLPNQPLKPVDILRFAFRGQSRNLLLVGLTAISATLLTMLTPILMGQIVSQVIPNANKGLLLQMGLALLGAAFGVAMFQLTQAFTLLRLEIATDAPTQAAVWDRTLKLKPAFFRYYSTGDLQSRISGITQIRRILSGSTLTTILTSLFALLNLGLMFYYSQELALIAGLLALVSIIVTTIHGLLTFKKNRALLTLQGNLFGNSVQLINGISKLRVSGAEKRAFAYWGRQYSQREKLTLEVQQIADSLNLFNVVLSPISSILLFWIAVLSIHQAQKAGTTTLTTGNFIAFNVAFGTFLTSATAFSNTLVNSLQVLNLWQRAQPILRAELEVEDSKTDPDRLSGRLSLDHVSFRYQADGPLILDDVSLRAEPGEFIALVGASGSGKSTILRLLLGFETPEAGVIYYDFQDLAKLDLQAVRRQLGVVLQSGRLLSGSIFTNIAGGALITQAEAWEAARMAGFADDITAMPMRMETVVSEGGGNLSGGQRQRLLIARALVLKPKILLFDEATSALDNKTQAIISDSLARLQVTRVVIAHRLSTIQNADRIYVIEKGQVVQQGKFEELSQQEGLFARLMARQRIS
ncbi:MAG: NHLP bacteriocin export ABC transporter permease/ATPase subunit [Chroococcidiopsidaceae cyanobacterium CP_BM_ER_R8_30]|nr:NHLP bacteriocin export ABC transporter permease/ATPase subunit [Chroococcidiopsidaceae cyanobacterium CP_BM_ER_R8_30]